MRKDDSCGLCIHSVPGYITDIIMIDDLQNVTIAGIHDSPVAECNHNRDIR